MGLSRETPSEYLELLSSVADVVGSRAALAGVFAVALSLLSTLLIVGAEPHRYPMLIPWGLLGLVLAAYVRDVRRAREVLRSSVCGQAPAEGPGSGGYFQRAQSLLRLRDAFRAAAGGDSLMAETQLARVERHDLSPQEGRIYDAVRVLACLDRNDVQRASQIAPLALPTGNRDLDLRLARLMVRAAWEDSVKLVAIERGLSAVGGSLRDLVLLCRVRRAALGSGEPEGLASRLYARVATEALAIGDEHFAAELNSKAHARGVYR